MIAKAVLIVVLLTSAYPIVQAAVVTLTPVADSHMLCWEANDERNTNYGNSQSLVLINDLIHFGQASGFTANTVLRFDLSAIPSGNYVSSALLKLRVIGMHPAGFGGNIEIYRVTAPWMEGTGAVPADGVTYYRRDGINTWTTPAGDYVGRTGMQDVDPYAVMAGPFTAENVGDQHIFDVTELVAEWLSGQYPNYGFLLHGSYGYDWELDYGSRENVVPLNRPVLEVEYGNRPKRGSISIRCFWDTAVQRAGRIERLSARLENPTEDQLPANVTLTVPPGVRIIGSPTVRVTNWARRTVYCTRYNCNPFEPVPEKRPNAVVTWRVWADTPVEGEFKVAVSGDDWFTSEKTLLGKFKPPISLPPATKVPDPQPAATSYLIGALHWPGWKTGTWAATGWSPIEPFPERKPALGWYDDSCPEVVDWEIKWALEHSISYFCYVWNRLTYCDGRLDPIVQPGTWGYAIHDGLFRSRFGSLFKFCIMYEYRPELGALQLGGLMPYWVENYFRRPNYLKLDNKPVLFFYEWAQRYIEDLGGITKVRELLDGWRRYCVSQGFAGLYVIAEYRGNDPNVVRILKDCGFDATFAYCFADQVPDGTLPATALDIVYSKVNSRVWWNIMPDVPTISVGWDPTPWQTYTNYWPTNHFYFRPSEYKALCERIKAMVDALPEGCLGKRLILLDNWNEWGEGHYIAPCRQAGFDYLDAVRDTFSTSPRQHIDILPEEVGLGPYDAPYLKWLLAQESVSPVSVQEAKKLADGTPVRCAPMYVTAVFGDCFYAEQPDRTAGIRLIKPNHGLSEGDEICVIGIMASDNATGERYIEVSNGTITIASAVHEERTEAKNEIR